MNGILSKPDILRHEPEPFAEYSASPAFRTSQNIKLPSTGIQMSGVIIIQWFCSWLQGLEGKIPDRQMR